MSELTPCNFCNWKRLRAEHPDAVLSSDSKMPGWIAVQVAGEFIAYFQALTDACAC